jgi:hypothetical protein
MMTKRQYAVAGLLLAMISLIGLRSLWAQERRPIEVGLVNWGRDYEAALALSVKTGKPIFALFQEVPG